MILEYPAVYLLMNLLISCWMKYTKTRGSGIQCEDNALVFNIATLSLTCANKNEFEFGNLWVSEVSGIEKL